MKLVDRLAIAPLRKAIELNPKNIKANQLLADLLLEQREFEKARDVLVSLYEFQPVAARSRLIQALFGLATSTDNDDERFKLYKRILELDSKQTKATRGCEKIWQRRGDEAYRVGDLETALHAYKAAHLEHKVAEVEIKLRYRGIDAQLKHLNELVQANHYQEALTQLAELAKSHSDERDWKQFKQEILDRDIEARLKVIAEFKQAARYEEALEELQSLAENYPNQRDWSKIEEEIPQHEFQVGFKLIIEAENAGDYQKALEQARLMLEDYVDKGDWAEDKIRDKIKFLEQELRHSEFDNRLTTLEYNKKQPETKTHLAGLFQRAFSALRESDKHTAQSLLSEVVILEKNYLDETRYLHFSVTGTDVIDVVKTMYQSVEEITEYRQQEETLKQLVAQEKNRGNQTQEKLIEYSQQEDNLKQLLVQEKNVLVKTEQTLLEYRQKEQELAQRLEQEQQARFEAEQVLTEYRQKEQELSQRLETKKQALIEFSQKENDLKQAIEEEKQTHSELTQQKTELEQRLEQEKQARLKAEQVLTESRQQEQELGQRLETEKQAFIEFSQKENQLKQAIEEEKQTHSELTQQQIKLEQCLEQEKQARIEAEQVLTESRQQEQELAQRLETEKQALIEFSQRENDLKQRLELEKQALTEYHQREIELKLAVDEEKYARVQAEELAKQKEKTADQYQQEIAQIQNELIAKENLLRNTEDELKNSSQGAESLVSNNKDKRKSRPYLGFIVGTVFFGIILIILVALWQIISYKPQMSVKKSINEPPASIIVTKPPAPITPTPAINPYKKICVHFKTKSWISISDKSGQNLYEGIYNAGEILTPKGLPPFYMKVGKMSGVYVGYNCSEITRVINYPKQIGSKNIFILGSEE